MKISNENHTAFMGRQVKITLLSGETKKGNIKSFEGSFKPNDDAITHSFHFLEDGKNENLKTIFFLDVEDIAFI